MDYTKGGAEYWSILSPAVAVLPHLVEACAEVFHIHPEADGELVNILIMLQHYFCIVCGCFRILIMERKFKALDK